MGRPFRSRDWHNVLSLMQEPGDGKLRHRNTHCRRNFFERLYNRDIGINITSLETWMIATSISLIQTVSTFNRPGQHPPSERRIGNEPDTEFTAEGKDFVFNKAGP